MVKDKLPPEPRFKPMEVGSDKAISETIQKMTGEEKQALYLLAKLTVRDKHRLAILESIASDFNLDWLSDYIKAYCTFSAAEEGKRAEQIVDIVKQPDIHMEGGGSLFGNIKDKIFH